MTARSPGDNAGCWPIHALATRFPRDFGCFSRIKKLLGRTGTRTRDRMYCQTIRTVRDISRDDRARIATCSLRTLTDRQTVTIDIIIMSHPNQTGSVGFFGISDKGGEIFFSVFKQNLVMHCVPR